MLLIEIMDKGFGLCPTNDNINNKGSFSELLFSFVLEKYIICDICTMKFPAFEITSCPASRTYQIATRSLEVVICPIDMCLTVHEFSFILFDLCLFITIFNFIFHYSLIVTFWIFTYYKIWIMLIIYCFIWNYWIIYFATCLEVFWSVMS